MAEWEEGEEEKDHWQRGQEGAASGIQRFPWSVGIYLINSILV